MHTFLRFPPLGRWSVLLVSSLGLLVAGCASKNVNPATPRNHYGYVDFFAENAGLCWQIEQLNDNGEPKQVFAQYSPLQDRVLRLAFAPGRYRFQIGFFDHVIAEPGLVEVEVKEGLITPVQVKLVEMGQALVETKQAQLGATAYGRYGRGTKIRADQSATFEVVTEPAEPQTYRPKQEMPYGKPSAP